MAGDATGGSGAGGMAAALVFRDGRDIRIQRKFAKMEEDQIRSGKNGPDQEIFGPGPRFLVPDQDFGPDQIF